MSNNINLSVLFNCATAKIFLLFEYCKNYYVKYLFKICQNFLKNYDYNDWLSIHMV
jgi:hypothetical protein